MYGMTFLPLKAGVPIQSIKIFRSSQTSFTYMEYDKNCLLNHSGLAAIRIYLNTSDVPEDNRFLLIHIDTIQTYFKLGANTILPGIDECRVDDCLCLANQIYTTYAGMHLCVDCGDPDSQTVYR